MIDLIMYIADLAAKYEIISPDFRADVTRLMVSNNWYGHQPRVMDGKLYVDVDYISTYGSRIEAYAAQYGQDDTSKVEYLSSEMAKVMPRTVEHLAKYAAANKLTPAVVSQMTDFLLAYLPGDLHLATDAELGIVMDSAFDNLKRATSDLIADFINWVGSHAKTTYRNHYAVSSYADRSADAEAYDPQTYLSLLYHLFNADFISKHNMYSRAAASKDYADTWLYLCLPLICAVRNTDLVRLPHPRLVSTPQATLEQIKTGRFSDNDARIVLGTVMDTLRTTMPVPNKTKGVSGVGSIKIIIPSSLEVHFGTLWAAAEAHFQLSGLPVEAPLIRVITTYEQIDRYMGTDIGNLFLHRNYSARAANKAYMQSIAMIAEQTNGASDGLRVSGYMLAALARSHKGSYGNFAITTYRYLRDAKLSGLTPEFVAKELYERGVMSAVPSMLLKMIAGKDYHRLSAGQQTAVTKSLDLSPLEVEQSVAVMQANARAAQEIAVELYSNHTPEQVLLILHRLGNGQAAAKGDYCMCLRTAMGQLCPYPGRNCITCPYEVTTRATLTYLASEVKRLQGQYKSAGNPIDQARYKDLATSVVLPAIDAMLSAIAQEHGGDAARDYEAIIKEVTHG